jgi:hypothetical protein
LQRAEASSAPGPGAEQGAAFASLSILATTRAGQLALVQSGARLHTGDQIELHVSVARRAYVHLFQISADGSATPLYPADNEPELLESDIEYRIPTNPGVRFELDDKVGTERIALIVTSRALDTEEDALRKFVKGVLSTGKWPHDAHRRAQATASAPRRADLPSRPLSGAGALRGFVRATTKAGRALEVEPDEGGVAVATFAFDHVP